MSRSETTAQLFIHISSSADDHLLRIPSINIECETTTLSNSFLTFFLLVFVVVVSWFCSLTWFISFTCPAQMIIVFGALALYVDVLYLSIK